MQHDTPRIPGQEPNVILYVLSIPVVILLLAFVITVASATTSFASAHSTFRTPHSAFGHSPDCDPNWQIVPGAVITRTTFDTLEAVAVASTNDVWAVGEVKPSSLFQTLIEHWNGTRWDVVPSPNTGSGSDFLTGVAALSSTDAWAVGYYSMDATWRTLVQHWDGTAWTIVTSDNVGSGGNYLTSVSVLSSGDIWAAGYYHNTTNGTDQTLILHSTGGSFTVQTSPNSGTVGNYLSAVEAIAADNVWAVGHYEDPSADRTLTLHWDGTAWTIPSSPNQGTGDNTLHAVTAAAGVLWAFGAYSGTGSIYKTLAMKWDPGNEVWNIVPTPNSGINHNYLNAADAIAANNIWAAGYRDSGNQTLIEHWDGSQWNIVPSPNAITGPIHGLAALSATDVWAAGDFEDTDTHALVERYNPCLASPTPSPTVTPNACTIPFTDVHPPDYFYMAVTYLYCHGAVSGYADNTFRPFNNITRSQLVKIDVLGFNLPIVTPTPGAYSFTDVTSTHPFFSYIETACSHNLISGYPCGGPGEPCDAQSRPYFRPFNDITRGQLSKIVILTTGWPLLNPATGTFQDVLPTSPFYTYIETAACHQLISGYTCGGLGEPCVPPGNRPYFRQNNNATRGQVAKIVYLAITGSPSCLSTPSP